MRGQSDVLAVVILVFITLILGMALFAYTVSQQSWLAGERARVSFLSLVSSSIDIVLVYSSMSNDRACMILEVINIGSEELYITIAVAPGIVREDRVDIRTEAPATIVELRSRNGTLEIPSCPSNPQPPGRIDLSSIILPGGYTLREAGAPFYNAPAVSLTLRPGASKTLYIEVSRGPVTMLVIAYLAGEPHLASSRIYTSG